MFEAFDFDLDTDFDVELDADVDAGLALHRVLEASRTECRQRTSRRLTRRGPHRYGDEHRPGTARVVQEVLRALKGSDQYDDLFRAIRQLPGGDTFVRSLNAGEIGKAMEQPAPGDGSPSASDSA